VVPGSCYVPSVRVVVSLHSLSRVIGVGVSTTISMPPSMLRYWGRSFVLSVSKG
jgi:hypothetical protein